MNASTVRGLLVALVAIVLLTHTRAAEPPVVRSLSFSPDGKLLTASVMPKDRGGLVFIWDVAKRELVAKYDRAGETPVAAFTADGKSIVIANGRKLLPVLDAKTGEKTSEIGPFPAEITSLACVNADKWVMLGKDTVLRLWDEKDKKVVAELTGYKRVSAWAVSPKGGWLFASGDGRDRLWDLTNGKEIENVFKPRPGTVNVGAFIAEDRLVLGSNSGSHRLVEVPSGKEVLRFKNEGGTGAIVYSAAAELLACRYYSSPSAALTPFTLRSPTADDKARTATLLKDCDSDEYATREKAAAALLDVGPAIEPLLREAAASGPSAEVRMRARVARETILNTSKHRLSGHQDEIRAMMFSPDGKLFATGGADGLVILWDPTTGKEIARLNPSVQ